MSSAAVAVRTFVTELPPKDLIPIVGEFPRYDLISDEDLESTEICVHHIGFSVSALITLRAAALELVSTNTGITRSNVGGYHSSRNLFDGSEEHHGFEGLHETLTALVREKWNSKRDRVDAELKQFRPAEAWANIMGEGNFHDLHDHSGATYSGVYYLEVGEEGAGGCTVFRTCVGEQCCEYFALTPRDNFGVLWPGSMVHAVTKYVGITKRISISYNFYVGSEAPRYC